MNPTEREQLEVEVDKSHQVKRLKDKFLDKFFADKERQIFDSIKALPLGDEKNLNAMHMMLKSMQSLQSEVNTVMNSGTMASMSLSEGIDKPKH